MKRYNLYVIDKAGSVRKLYAGENDGEIMKILSQYKNCSPNIEHIYTLHTHKHTILLY